MFDSTRVIFATLMLGIAPLTQHLNAQNRPQEFAQIVAQEGLLRAPLVTGLHEYDGAAAAHEMLSHPAQLHISQLPLVEALDALQESSGVPVGYSPTLLPRSVRVTCDCMDLNVEQALEQMLRSTGLEVNVVSGTLIIGLPHPHSGIAPTGALAASVSLDPLPAYREQAGIISGRVVDANTLQPLASAQVVVSSLGIGALSRTDGTYTLNNIPPGEHLVETRVIGYQTGSETVTIAGNVTATANFYLTPTAVALDQIVVVGYGTQSRATLSGAVTSVNSQDIARTSATTTTDALIGKVAGINTRNTLNTGQFQFSGTGAFSGREAQDGRPGSTTVIQIRNMGDPLFVIDGVPVTQKEFDNLNTADIENISVLKDASASIYGFRASNGVILVTTKRGDTGQGPQLRLDGYYGWQDVKRSRSPWGYVDNAYQFMYSQLETEQNTGIARSLTADELERWRVGGPGYESYDYWPLVVNNANAPQANLNASLSGGMSDARYYLSVGHVTQDYVIQDNLFNRTNFQSNLQATLFEGFSLGTELRGRIETHVNTAQTDADDPINMHFQAIQRGWPTQNPYANGNPDYINGNIRLVNINPAIFSRSISGTQDQIRRNVSGNFWAEYRLPFGPTIRGTYNLTNNWHDFDIHRFTYDAYCYDEAADSYAVCSSYTGGTRQHVKELEEKHFGQLQMSYSREFGLHSLAGVAAFELAGDEGNHTEVRATTDSNVNSLLSLQNVNYLRNAWYDQRRASYVGRLNYDYEQRYLLELLGRYDGSYLYADDRRWGFFPGISVGWRVSQEPFLRDRLAFLDELKLRASWGEAGREQGISPWDFLGGVTYPSADAALDGQLIAGARPRGLPITNLSWVTSTSRNFGIEFAMLDNRVSGEIDLFERKLSGLPASRNDVLLPLEVGYALPNENLESEATRGIEGIIRYSDRIGEVGISVAPNATLARRRILDRYKPRYGNSLHQYRSGSADRWAGVVFAYRHAGQFQSMEEIAEHPVDIDGQGNRTMLPGDIYYVDLNEDGLINSLDTEPIGYPGNTPPLLSFGLSGSFSWRNITLNHDWSGGALFNVWPSALRQPYTGFDNGGQFAWSRWRRADPFNDQSEWIPGRFPPLRKGSAGAHTNGLRSDFYEFKARYLRLTRIEVGYAVPSNLSERFGASQMRAYVSGSNLWLVDNGSHKWAMDPEQAQCCGQLYPPSSNLTIGFSASFGGIQRSVPAPVLPASDQ